ncbi:MAG: GAF domain-containing protein [Myxococcales bacterium]|nr:GAF domain-containing protein [Myxococcales bacterium]
MRALPSVARYAELLGVAEAVLHGESDLVASAANLTALLWEHLPDLNWVGVYWVGGTPHLARLADAKAPDGLPRELVLGPFQGKVACVRIQFERGVCGAAARSGETQRIADVHTFPGHIACDVASRAELVVPIRNTQGVVIGVLDLDSPVEGRFDEIDQAGVEALARLLTPVPSS